MKTGLRTVMTLKVHYLLFVLACAGLVGVAVGARVIADEIYTIAEATVQQLSTFTFAAAGG